MITAEITVNLVFGFVIYGLATFVLLRMVNRLNDPYREVIKKLFLLSLFLMISGWLLSFFNYGYVFLSNSGKLIAGCGVVIAIRKEFRRGYEEVFGL